MKLQSYNMLMTMTSKKASLDIRTLKESLKNGSQFNYILYIESAHRESEIILSGVIGTLSVTSTFY